MFREKATVIKNQRIAPGHYAIAFSSLRIGKTARPGQFVQILCSETGEPLLPRPFSFLETGPKGFEILYHVVGKGTEILSRARKGDTFPVLGPLGNGFTSTSGSIKGREIVLVGGGVGIPPLYHFARTGITRDPALRKRIHVFLGARNRSLLLCEKEFKKLGVDLQVATDDGSKGKKGFVTSVLDRYLSDSLRRGERRFAPTIYTCGPTPMMHAVSKLAQQYEVPCEVSVEVPMACGFGVCLGCAVKVSENGVERYAIACTEGPVFKSRELIWQ